MTRWLAATTALVLSACGGDDGDTTCDVPPVGAIGGTCGSGSDCEGSGWCYREFAGGYCSGTPCELSDDCGVGYVCGTVDGYGVRECLLACSGTDAACECPDGMVCSSTFVGTELRARACVPGNAAATDGSPCASSSDCHDGDWCWRDALQAPGGVCVTWGCGACAPGGDGVCVDGLYFGTNQVFEESTCVDTCVVDSDCRRSEGYRCLDAPPAAVGLMCRATWVGDPCATDTDCGASPWRCATDGFPGGYCTVDCADDGDCPTDTACDETRAQPMCRRHCFEPFGDCRDGYVCGAADGDSTCVPETP